MTLPTRVPLCICGTTDGCMRSWKPAVAEIARRKSFDELSCEYVEIDDTPGDLVLSGPDPHLEGEHVHAYLVMRGLLDELHTSHDEREKWYQSAKETVLSSRNELWVALGILSRGWNWPRKTSYESEAGELSRIMLRRLLVWWPKLCQLDDRFSDGASVRCRWPSWGAATWGLVRALGKDDAWIRQLQRWDAEYAGERLRRVVEST